MTKTGIEYTLSAIFILTVLVIRTKAKDDILRPLVHTKNGWVRGLKSPEGYEKFLGIRYGKVREDNPFGVADPYPSYKGIFDANDDNNPCPQFEESFNILAGTLDCLRLNVYTPRKIAKLPVMVFIHGGRFHIGQSGEKRYDPVFLMRQDIVFVSLNYRLGVYGFMCLGIREVPGNTGLKDQLMALRWIKSNIHAFGGDPNRITVFGQSAGAMSIDYHVHSRHVDLFQQAILQSGTITSMISIGIANASLPLTIANNLGFKTTDLYEALRFLSKQEPLDVVQAIPESPTPASYLVPCVEKEFDGVENVITEVPSGLIPRVKNKKFLLGDTNDEYNFFVGNKPDEFFDNSDTIRRYLNYYFKFDAKELDEAVNRIRKFYIGDDEFSSKYKRQMINMLSDIIYIYPVYRELKIYREYGAERIYYYIFAYSGGRNILSKLSNLTDGTATHADELGYLFQHRNSANSSQEDEVIINRMTTMWANFAKYGSDTNEI